MRNAAPVRPRRAALLAALLAPMLALGACDRNMEPYDPDEEVRQPDLSKIFPEGAERAAEQEGGGSAMGGGPPGGGPPGAPGGRPPGGPAPPPGASRGSSAAADTADAPPVEGRIRIAPELEGRVPPRAVLFLVARGEGGGPPVAVQRIPSPSFPLAFELGPEDRMMENVPFAGPFRITVRVDADGNASTRNPGDLRGTAEGRPGPGDSGVSILIDEVL